MYGVEYECLAIKIEREGLGFLAHDRFPHLRPRGKPVLGDKAAGQRDILGLAFAGCRSTREPRGSIEQEVEEGLASLLARSTGEIISESMSCGPVDLRQGLQKRGNALGELETVARRQR